MKKTFSLIISLILFILIPFSVYCYADNRFFNSGNIVLSPSANPVMLLVIAAVVALLLICLVIFLIVKLIKLIRQPESADPSEAESDTIEEDSVSSKPPPRKQPSQERIPAWKSSSTKREKPSWKD